MRSIAVIGNTTRDLVDGIPRVGGGPYHAGRALRTLGRYGILLTQCAEADRRALLSPLVCLGVPVFWQAAASTATFVLDYDGEQRRVGIETVGPSWSQESALDWVRKRLGDIDWVQVVALTRTDFPAETLAALARGRRILLDGQGLMRPALTGPVRMDADFDRDALRHVVALKLSEEEALIAAGGLDRASLRSLGVAEVLVTLGSRGSLVLANGSVEMVPARRVEPGVDPTGAGDAFAATYAACRAVGYAPLSAAQRASEVVADLLAERVR